MATTVRRFDPAMAATPGRLQPMATAVGRLGSTNPAVRSHLATADCVTGPAMGS